MTMELFLLGAFTSLQFMCLTDGPFAIPDAALHSMQLGNNFVPNVVNTNSARVIDFTERKSKTCTDES